MLESTTLLAPGRAASAAGCHRSLEQRLEQDVNAIQTVVGSCLDAGPARADGGHVLVADLGRYRAPVWVDNDVNVLALGEWRSGIAAGHDNVVVVKIGTGIGAGIIADGRLHRGAQGSAGDVGHIQVSDDPAVICRCGNVGCLEALAGGEAIGRAGEMAARDGRSARLRVALDAAIKPPDGVRPRRLRPRSRARASGRRRATRRRAIPS
jgi:predicted NBD/HSP70 family sugar kinase